MPAAVSIVRTTYTDSDSLSAAAFNAVAIASATVPDATAGSAGVMPATTTAAGLAMIAAANAAAQRTLLGLGTADAPSFAGLTLTGAQSITLDSSSAMLALRNTVAGVAKYTRLSLGNDASASSAEIYNFSSTYTPNAWEKANGMAIYSAGSGGLSLVSQSGDVRVLAGSLASVIGTFSTTGLVINGQLTQYSATFAKTGTSLTNAAEAQVATLTNAPVGRSGNPTKWVPIDDNGVTRYMPAW